MKIIYITAAAALLAGCAPTPTPLCDRANVEWTKYGTAEIQQECEARYVPVVVAGYTSSDRDGRRDIRLVSDIPDSDGPADPEKPERPVKPKHEKPEGKKGKKNNGLGNGDQPAPGRSLTRNRAENQVGNPGHRSGKPQNSN